MQIYGPTLEWLQYVVSLGKLCFAYLLYLRMPLLIEQFS